MNWYYAKNGKQEGPVPKQELRDLITRGEVSPGDLVWKEGMDLWTPAGEIADLAPQPEELPSSNTIGAGPGVTSAPPPPPAPPAGEVASQTEQPQPGMPHLIPPPPTSGFAIASMVCGIISLPLCWVWALAGIPAVIFGHMAIKSIKKSETPIEGRGMAIAGLVTGYLAILFQVIFIGIIVFAMISKA